MYQTFLCLITFVITCLNIPQVDNAGCNDLVKKNIFECYHSNVSSETSDHLCNDINFLNNANLSYEVLIPTAGKVELTFDLGSNCLHEYEILIQCSDNCENMTENYHSELKYKRQSKNHNLQKCGQIIQVQLEYIFSSCYQITLRTIKGGIYSKIFEKMFIETKFVKELFDANTTKVAYAWNGKQKPAELFTYVNNKIYKEVIDICLELGKDNLSLIWTASCNLGINNRICNTTLIDKDGHHAIDCTISQRINIIITCRVQNITEGVYVITSMILNEPVRCVRSNNVFVWGSPNCKVYNTSNMTEINTGYIQEKSDKFIILYLFLLFILIFTVTVISLISYNQCKKRIRNDHNYLLNPPDILLLYARDCIPFMEAMTSLRDLLENTEICSKVYDIHDEKRREEILTNKINWVSNILCNRSVKILIVLSTCGTRQILRQTSAIDFYTEPETHEDLFLHTIQILRNESVYSNRKIYVCTFDFTQNERNVLTNLKEVKQYLLPNQIKKLIKDLFKTKQYINVDDFNDKCRNFNVYIKENPHYLRNIIRACSLNMTQL